MECEAISEEMHQDIVAIEFIDIYSVFSKSPNPNQKCNFSTCSLLFSFSLPVHIRYSAISDFSDENGLPFATVEFPPPILYSGVADRPCSPNENRPSRSQESNELHCPSRSSNKRFVRHYFDRNRASHPSVRVKQGLAAPAGSGAVVYTMLTAENISQSHLIALVPVGDKNHFLLATWGTLAASLLSTVVLMIIFRMRRRDWKSHLT